MLNPLPGDRWNYETAAHLLNRAGFGGPPAEIQKLATLGHDKAISSLIDYEHIIGLTPDPVWAHPDPERLAKLRQDIKSAKPEDAQALKQAENKLQAERMLELRGWWFNRMAKGPRPFQEKMVLFWHGHFATSIEKVRNTPNSSYLMWRQNELFRRLATGNWLEMLTDVGKDPAMLVWLDQAQSRKEHPNENFAREVMELFSLGEGHYTEHDITEAARALTGWSYNLLQEIFVYRPLFHDNGMKTIFGQTGNFNGEDFLAQIVKQPQSAIFITAKLWNFFAGQMPSPQLNEALAEVFRANGNNFKPLLRAMFRSEEFYDNAVLRNAVKSPVQWLVGSVRMLECDLLPAFVCAAITRSLGQDLFAPPNVKGWDGGMSWITTNTLLTRYNDAATLVQGTIQQMSANDFARKPGGAGGQKFEKMAERVHFGGVDAEKILTREQRADKKSLVAALEHRLLQSTLSNNQEKALHDFLDSKTTLSDADILTDVRLVMSTPEYQVA
ncbi:MAG TPA: DUF1800 domain-containing protein [Methylomirabilota bacterium]|nr:DUF1800 domain-containing protein [Methylomirabilota bacterium]